MSAAGGSLVIYRPAPGGDEVFIIVEGGGAVRAHNGHVDLGTGIRTALAQIVAEELDVAFGRVTMVLGDTAQTPNQGPTIASETIQVAAKPLRAAAAQARRHLLGLAALQLNAAPEDLTVEDGAVSLRTDPGRTVTYGALIGSEAIRLELDAGTPAKAPGEYRIVGQPVPRVDLPAKATGGPVYVHDVRLPGMVHGRVVRPPYVGRDSGDFVGRSLIGVDESSVGHIAGLVGVVTRGDFIGVAAEREENAERAMAALKVAWRPVPEAADLGDLERALKANPGRKRTLLDKGDVDGALAAAKERLKRTYVWPYQLHGSIGPSCAVARWEGGRLTVWSGSQNPHQLRGDLARLFAMEEGAVEIVRLEAAGCYGRNGADDVSADAALLARGVGRPVRVQLTRAQEHLWEPKGAAQLMEVDGGIDAAGGVAGYDFQTRYPSNTGPNLALLLTGVVAPAPLASEMGDRTAIAPYDFDHMRVAVHDMAPIVRASWMRGVSALPNTFAHESYMDELAAAAGADPVAYRLRYLKDGRAAALVEMVAREAGWQARSGPRLQVVDHETVKGQGFAYAVYVHGAFPGTAAAWSAWVADVEVNRRTGEVKLARVVAGQDSGLVVNPAGVTHQIHGNVLQSASRALKEELAFEDGQPVAAEWGAYPILNFAEVPAVNVLIVPRPEEPPLGVGESASVPSAAAIANAIYDATGVRLREPPFTPERVKAALDGSKAMAPPVRAAVSPPRKRLGWYAAAASLAAGLATASLTLPFKPAIAPIARPDPAVFSAETIARGRLLAELGDCAVCHTAPGGTRLAGGRALETPFGTIHSTNITPDPETGIGAWSYPAFERAMREGVHRDGRQLYPAFPYTSFTKVSDADLQALYAYLMAEPPVRATAPMPALRFPFDQRPLMAAWNTLFHKAGAYQPDPRRPEDWNRGAYLVEGLGHCSACHSPRNALGAEEKGAAHLGGGIAEGWDAPALTELSRAPVPWTEGDFYTYLRTGFSERHGAAAGPMAPVIDGLRDMPDSDLRAMATYLASLNPGAVSADAKAIATRAEARTAAGVIASPGARIYDGACAVCHESEGPSLFGVKPRLALNSDLHGERPDNLIRVVLDGMRLSGRGERGAMPAFRDSFSDAQVAELVGYMRSRFAPSEPPWTDVSATVARLRAEPRTSW